MAQISPNRMIGRIDQAAQLIMRRNNLAVTDPKVDTAALLVGLSSRVNEKDGQLCMRLLSILMTERANAGAPDAYNPEARAEYLRGQQEAAYIFGKYPYDYENRITDDHDYLADYEEELRQLKAKKRRKLRIVFLVAAAVVLAAIIYNLPYFGEMRAYDRVVKASEEKFGLQYEVDNYVREYPDGKHIDDVLILPVRAAAGDEYIFNTLEAVDNYLDKRPDGKYKDEVIGIRNGIWDAEIARYEEAAKGSSDRAGVEYVVGMLRYMRDNNLHYVVVSGTPVLELKEYSEYPEIVRKFLEVTQEASANLLLSNKLPDDMVTIKDQVTEETAANWNSMVRDALQNGFDRVLTKGFIQFVGYDSNDDSPTVNITYTVKTQDTEIEGYTFPDIWEQKGQFVGGSIKRGFLMLGISMDFKADFSYPGLENPFIVTAQGNPGDTDIKADRKGAYTIMCERCTRQFSDKIESDFGIPTQEAVEAAEEE